MKSSLEKINHFTPLLTDTLPYEVPFFFSNSGIYQSLKEEYDDYFKDQNIEKARGQNVKKSSRGRKIVNRDMSLIAFFLKKYFCKSGALQNLIGKTFSIKNAVSIPYEYEIKNTDKGNRNISLIHPVAQIKICDFYQKHKNMILFYCGKSSYSIRYPTKVTSRTVTKYANLLKSICNESEVANTSDLAGQDVGGDGRISLSKIPVSYFVLEKYRMLHDFYDSSDMLNLERKFSKCRRVDIKRCFESIYTHSISWAVKDKEYVKKHLGAVSRSKQKPFEDEFDRIMRFSNHNETHGIPIGAETSRLFSEIILQKIDLKIQQGIKATARDKIPIKERDFEIKRYMDDFFIFTNDERTSERIQEICERELKSCKLFINESKTTFSDRPFVTPTSSAKQSVAKILNKYLNDFGLRTNASNTPKRSPKYEDALQVINKIRGAIHDHKLSFYNVSNLTLSILKTDLLKTFSYIQKQKKTDGMFVSAIFDYLKNFIGGVFCSFRLNSHSFTVTSMFKKRIKKREEVEKIFVSKIRNYLNNFIVIAFYVFHLSPRFHTASTIFKICYIILEILETVGDAELMGEIKQELFNKLMAFCERISDSQDENIFEFLDLVSFLDVLGDNFRINEDRLKAIFDTRQPLPYFKIVVLLSYIKKDYSYRGIRKIVLKSCEEKLSNGNGLKKTENFLLFFDLIKCPHLELDEKKKILECVGIQPNNTDVVPFIEGKKWFFDWEKQENLDLRSVLEIKEARLGY